MGYKDVVIKIGDKEVELLSMEIGNILESFNLNLLHPQDIIKYALDILCNFVHYPLLVHI